MRSKSFTHILALVLVACVSFTMAFSASTLAAEAKAAPKLSAKSVTLAKGGKARIELKNARKGSWSIDKNGVASIQKKTGKYVTIRPVKAGTATLTCKAGNKKLTCRIKVLNNKIGTPPSLDPPEHFIGIAGKTQTIGGELPEGISFKSKSYDKSMMKVSTSYDSKKRVLTIKVKPLKPGKTVLRLSYKDSDGNVASEDLPFIFINGFRGNEKVSKTASNYKKWRKKTISSMVSSDMTTWEIIDALGTLISTGKYSGKGGVTGRQLWYGGNGTCISGAKMMNDFMKDLGISSKVRFMGKAGLSTDIYGFTISYASQHKNTWIRLGGRRYELNPQPEMTWPIGIVKR